jgi:hypothetical protein
MTLDQRTCADIAVTATPVAAITSSTIITGGSVITISSIIGVTAVVFVVVLFGQPGAQETPCHQVLLN